jgi:hypothetical protein
MTIALTASLQRQSLFHAVISFLLFLVQRLSGVAVPQKIVCHFHRLFRYSFRGSELS